MGEISFRLVAVLTCFLLIGLLIGLRFNVKSEVRKCEIECNNFINEVCYDVGKFENKNGNENVTKPMFRRIYESSPRT